MAIKGIYRPLKARKKSLKNYDVTSFDNSFYDFEFPRRNAIATAILNT